MSPFIEKLIIVFYFIKYRYFTKFSSRQALKTWQQKKLQKFILKVKERSRYYKKLWGEKNFQDFPQINKALMMQHFSELNTAGLDRDECLKLAIESETSRDFSIDNNGITVGLSSGTSGHRGLFVASPFERAKYAGTILAKALPHGRVFKKTKVALFLRANSNLYKAVDSKLIAFKFFDILKDIKAYKNELEAYQPDLLIAQPSVLKVLAEMKLNHQLTIKPLRIFSAAEVLEPLDQKYIESAFEIKLHQIYQCTEGFLGISCEYGTLHLNEDLMIIEQEPIGQISNDQKVIDRNSTSQQNHEAYNYKFQPIISDFNRFTQPIIKYKLNDILTVRQDPCPCGSSLLAIASIDGRSDDTIYFPRSSQQDWQIVWSDLIRNHILYVSSSIEEYSVLQKENSNLEISLKTQDNIKKVQAEVLTELQKLADRLHCDLPKIEFTCYVHNSDFSKKIRRISSNFEPAPGTSL